MYRVNASLGTYVRMQCFLGASACAYNLTVILLYDWLLCLDQEVACIWKGTGGLNAGSLVYLLSRFPLMMGGVFDTTTIFPLSPAVSGLVFRWSSAVV